MVDETNFASSSINSSEVVRSSIRSTSIDAVTLEPKGDVLPQHALSKLSNRRVIEDSMG